MGSRFAWKAVDFLYTCFDRDPRTLQFAEIDLRPLDGHDTRLTGRDTAYREDRQALGRRFIDRADDSAVAVRVREMLIRPCLSVCGETVCFQLPRGNQHLLQLVFFRVAIDVDIIEHVVRDEGLQLLKRLPCNAVVPQPDIAENRRVRLQDSGRRLSLPADGAGLDAIEPETQAGQCNVVRDVRRLAL